MKRKNLEIKKEISTKIENSNISNILFSNKILRENKKIMKNIEISKSYKIGDLTFDSLESANRYILKSLFDSGLEEIIKNPENFITALRSVTNPNSNPEKVTSHPGSGNMRDIQKILEKDGYLISRHHEHWPVYILVTPEKEKKVFRYTGKVHELHQLVLQIGIEEIAAKYSHRL